MLFNMKDWREKDLPSERQSINSLFNAGVQLLLGSL